MFGLFNRNCEKRCIKMIKKGFKYGYYDINKVFDLMKNKGSFIMLKHYFDFNIGYDDKFDMFSYVPDYVKEEYKD